MSAEIKNDREYWSTSERDLFQTLKDDWNIERAQVDLDETQLHDLSRIDTEVDGFVKRGLIHRWMSHDSRLLSPAEYDRVRNSRLVATRGEWKTLFHVLFALGVMEKALEDEGMTTPLVRALADRVALLADPGMVDPVRWKAFLHHLLAFLARPTNLDKRLFVPFDRFFPDMTHTLQTPFYKRDPPDAYFRQWNEWMHAQRMALDQDATDTGTTPSPPGQGDEQVLRTAAGPTQVVYHAAVMLREAAYLQDTIQLLLDGHVVLTERDRLRCIATSIFGSDKIKTMTENELKWGTIRPISMAESRLIRFRTRNFLVSHKEIRLPLRPAVGTASTMAGGGDIESKEEKDEKDEKENIEWQTARDELKYNDAKQGDDWFLDREYMRKRLTLAKSDLLDAASNVTRKVYWRVTRSFLERLRTRDDMARTFVDIHATTQWKDLLSVWKQLTIERFPHLNAERRVRIAFDRGSEVFVDNVILHAAAALDLSPESKQRLTDIQQLVVRAGETKQQYDAYLDERRSLKQQFLDTYPAELREQARVLRGDLEAKRTTLDMIRKDMSHVSWPRGLYDMVVHMDRFVATEPHDPDGSNSSAIRTLFLALLYPVPWTIYETVRLVLPEQWYSLASRTLDVIVHSMLSVIDVAARQEMANELMSLFACFVSTQKKEQARDCIRQFVHVVHRPEATRLLEQVIGGEEPALLRSLTEDEWNRQKLIFFHLMTLAVLGLTAPLDHPFVQEAYDRYAKPLVRSVALDIHVDPELLQAMVRSMYKGDSAVRDRLATMHKETLRLVVPLVSQPDAFVLPHPFVIHAGRLRFHNKRLQARLAAWEHQEYAERQEPDADRLMDPPPHLDERKTIHELTNAERVFLEHDWPCRRYPLALYVKSRLLELSHADRFEVEEYGVDAFPLEPMALSMDQLLELYRLTLADGKGFGGVAHVERDADTGEIVLDNGVIRRWIHDRAAEELQRVVDTPEHTRNTLRHTNMYLFLFALDTKFLTDDEDKVPDDFHEVLVHWVHATLATMDVVVDTTAGAPPRVKRARRLAPHRGGGGDDDDAVHYMDMPRLDWTSIVEQKKYESKWRMCLVTPRTIPVFQYLLVMLVLWPHSNYFNQLWDMLITRYRLQRDILPSEPSHPIYRLINTQSRAMDQRK